MSRLAGDMKGFVVLGVYRSTVEKQSKEKTLLRKIVFDGVHVLLISTKPKHSLLSSQNSSMYFTPKQFNSHFFAKYE